MSIDSDLVFKPEFIDKTVNVKSVLYLLPQMDLAIPKSIKTFFTTLDPHLIILSWLKGFDQKNQEYYLLFARLAFQNTRFIYQGLLPQNEVPLLEVCLEQKVFVDLDLHYDPFYPKILVSENMLSHISEKLQLIEKTLLDNHSASAQILFEEISPILGKFYRKLRFEFNDPEKALDALWGENENGVDYSDIESLLDPEELDNFPQNKNFLNENLVPETFFSQYKSNLISGEALPLDSFIKRHSERKKKNLLSLNQALEELQLLIQEGFTESQSLRDIVDFWFSLSKMTETDPLARDEIRFLLSNLSTPELKWLLTLEKYFLRVDSDVPELSSLTITGAFMKQRIFHLTESEKLYLFDDEGNIKKNTSLTGRSKVTCFPEKDPEFYLKQYPEWPGYEFASTLFMRLLGVTHLPYQEFIINKNHGCPVLLTQAIDGDPVFHVWQDPEAFNHLDPFQTGLLIIAAILLNPEDGKEDNYILSPDGNFLIPIDNDHCFLPSTFQKGKFWNFIVNTALQTKTLLFCLDEMNKRIPNEVKQHILSIKFDSLLTSWLQELIKIEDRYNNLVDQEQRNAFREKGTVLRIPFYEQFIHNLYWKVNKIQDLLKSPLEQTPFSLLKAMEPFAAKCYQDSFQHGNTLESRFKAATSELYVDLKSKSRMSILDTQGMMKIINLTEKDLQNDLTWKKMGPPNALELVKQLIQEGNQNRKLEQDLLCELDNPNEEDIWTTLFGNPLLETALKNFFANPKAGLMLKGSKLITGNNLANLFEQTPGQGTKIKFLSLPNSPLLDSRAIRTLVEGCPNLEYLNVSGCTSLEEILSEKGEWPLLARLEVKECLSLRKLRSFSPMKILRIGTHQKIEIFIDKSTLDSFTISTQTNKFDFLLEKGENFEIKFLEKDANVDDFLQSALLQKEVFDRYFKHPKITIGTHLILSPKDLAVFITVIDLTASNIDKKVFQEIVQLRLQNLKSLKLPLLKEAGTGLFEDLIQGDWPKLVYLNLSDNEINDEGLAILSQRNWPLLVRLNLENAKITKKGLLNFVLNPNWINLRELAFSRARPLRNEFPTLLLKNNEYLVRKLDLSSGQIAQSEIEAIINNLDWSRLEYLDLSYNNINDGGLEILASGNWPLLETLNLENARITSVGIEAIIKKSKWSNLKHLNLSYNEIDDRGFEILPKGNWRLLETLNMNHTRVTNKGLLVFYWGGKWPNLKELNLPYRIDFDLASSLHQKKISQVERLELNNLEMNSLEIEAIVNKFQFQRLKYLDISKNRIFDEGVSLLSLTNWSLLEELNLRNTGITPKEIEAIVNQSEWKKLKNLNLSENQLSDEGVSFLVQADWPFLETLNMHNTNITPKGIETLVKQSKWQELKHLDISGNEFSDEGLSSLTLVKWPLLENLNIQNINITLKGIETITNWKQLKHLNISNNKIFDEGILICAQKEWPSLEELFIKNTKITSQGIETLVNKMDLVNLKKLDVSENTISNEGLRIIASAKWPLFQHLIYYDTKVTLKGNITLLKNLQWPNLHHLEHSFTESFSNSSEYPKIVLAKIPMHYKTESILVTVLNMTWLNSKEIYLSTRHRSFHEKILILPCEKLEQLQYPKLSPPIIRPIVWPSNLRLLDLSNNSLSDGDTLQSLFLTKCLFLEELNLEKTNLTAKGIGMIVSQSDWPSLKKLCFSHNQISDYGLRLLFSRKWHFLESLSLRNTGITADGLERILNRSECANLKFLDVSDNLIYDKGLKILLSGKWPLLESLGLEKTHMTAEGVKILVATEKWLNLKILDISSHFIYDFGLQILSERKWPLLESLSLRNTCITSQGIKSLVKISKWSNLKVLDLSTNKIYDRGLVSLSSVKWTFLETLSLGNTGITIEGIKSLISFSKLSNLKTLDVSNNFLYDEGLEILSLGAWPLLEILNIRCIFVKEYGVLRMAKTSNWPNLKALDASYNEISDIGLKILSSGKWLLLENLKVVRTNITFEGIKQMTERSEWPNLKEIHITNYLGSAEIFAIKKLTSAKWLASALLVENK